MTDEQHDAQPKDTTPSKVGGNKKLYIILVAILIVGAGGFGGYWALTAGKDKGGANGSHEEKKIKKSLLIAADPFVVNLAEQGRYLRITMQFEIEDATNQPLVTEKMPNIRDAVITLLSSKSSESVSGPEGKFQLKDEILLRVNQAVGKDAFKNLFFTDFVMQ